MRRKERLKDRKRSMQQLMHSLLTSGPTATLIKPGEKSFAALLRSWVNRCWHILDIDSLKTAHFNSFNAASFLNLFTCRILRGPLCCTERVNINSFERYDCWCDVHWHTALTPSKLFYLTLAFFTIQSPGSKCSMLVAGCVQVRYWAYVILTALRLFAA